MIKKRIRNALAFCALMSILPCCTTVNIDNMEVTYNPSLAVPIGNFNASLFDVVDYVNADYLEADSSTNMVYYIWRENNNTINFDLNDFSYGEVVTFTEKLENLDPFSSLLGDGKFNIPAGDYDFTTTSSYEFRYNENTSEKIIEIDSVTISNAQFNCDINVSGISLSNENWLEIMFVFPNITNSEKNQFSIKLTSNTGSIRKEMSNFTAYFSDDKNTINLKLFYTLHSNGSLSFEKNLQVDYTTKISSIDVNAIYGYFWSKEAITNDEIHAEIPTDFFNQDLFVSNKLLFSNPEIYMNVYNTNGLPVRFFVDEIYATSNSGNKYYADFNGNKYCSMDIKRADTPGETAKTTIKFDKDNGKTYQLFEEFPKDIHYKWKIFIDDVNKTPRQFAFIPANMKMDIEVRLPLQFNPTSEFSYKDTIDADFSSLAENDIIPEEIDIEYINIHLDIANGLPVNIDGTFKFLDENDNVVYSVDSVAIASATINDEGIAQLHSESHILLPFKGDDIELLFKTKKINLTAKVSGYNNESKIDIRANNRLNIHISAFAKAKATANLDSITNK